MDNLEIIDVYHYTDYRRFLADLFAQRQKTQGLSYRIFAHKAGFSSHAYLKQIIMGTRRVSVEAARKIARGFDLSDDQAEYLEHLIRFNQASDSLERNEYYAKMIKLKPKEKVAKFEREHYIVFSQWYYLAVRELVALPGFKEDESWIAKRLYPNITKSQAREALALLIKIGYLQRNEQGKLVQTEPDLSTGAEIKSLHSINYHNELFGLASHAMQHTKPQWRDISSFVDLLSQEEFHYIKKSIIEFRKQIRQYLVENRAKKKLAQDNNMQTLYNINIQFFNTSRIEWDGDEGE